MLRAISANIIAIVIVLSVSVTASESRNSLDYLKLYIDFSESQDRSSNDQLLFDVTLENFGQETDRSLSTNPESISFTVLNYEGKKIGRKEMLDELLDKINSGNNPGKSITVGKEDVVFADRKLNLEKYQKYIGSEGCIRVFVEIGLLVSHPNAPETGILRSNTLLYCM